MAGAPSEMTETTDRLIATPTAYRDPAGIQDKVLPVCLPKGLAVVSAGSSWWGVASCTINLQVLAMATKYRNENLLYLGIWERSC